MAIVYIMRHGETPYNVLGLLTGRGSDPALTINGIKQAESAGKHLQEHHIDNIAYIVSSNMTRTNQTANIVNEYLNKPMLFDESIQEIDRGGFEGHAKHYVLPIVNNLEDHESHDIHGGESLNEFRDRMTIAVCKYLYTPEEAVLLVSHGYSTEVVIEKFLGIKEEIHNAHITTLDPNKIQDLAGKCHTVNDDVCYTDC